MALDPDAQQLMTTLAAAYPDIGGTATDAGEIRAHLAALPPSTVPLPEVGAIEAGEVDVRNGRRAAARIYRPAHTDAAPPVVAFFHGGGWVIGDLDSHDAFCRVLCREARAIIVSVDYERAPENPFPGMVEDAYAATCAIAERAEELGGDPERFGIAGDSAGGNIAAAVALMVRGRGGPAMRAQLLVYPVTGGPYDTASWRENGEGYFLTERRMRWYWDQYVPDEARRTDPLASPLLAPDLSGLPPAIVVTAEHDPLRDEGEAYAARLAEAGVEVTARRFDGMFHGFMSFPHLLAGSANASEEAFRGFGRLLAA